MNLLDQEQSLRNQIFQYFGYKEDWCIYPFDDARDYFWRIQNNDNVIFSETEEDLDSDGNYYRNEIYTQRFLNKWVYRGEEYTMILVDTHTDGNKFLQIFDNSKERNI